MKELTRMRQEMSARKARSQANQANSTEVLKKAAMVVPARPTIGRVLERTPIKSAAEIRDQGPPPTIPAKPMTRAQTEALLKGGQNALRVPIPDGYKAASCNERGLAEAFAERAWDLKVLSFDFETDADQDEGVDILRDRIVGMSVACEAGKALYFPVEHDAYAANWDVIDLIQLFKPLWESVDVLKIAFNIKFEHQILLRHGVRMPYTNVADPMIMVMLTAQFEEVALKTVVSEILSYLFDKYAEEVLTEALEPEELDALMIDEGDAQRFKQLHDEAEIPLDQWKEAEQKKAFWDAFVTPFKKVTERTVSDGVYKGNGKNHKKGDPKFKKVRVSFNEMPIDKKTVDYGCKDSDWALQVYQILKPVLEKEGLMKVHDLLDAPFMMVLGEIELEGWRVRPDLLKQMYKDADEVLNGVTNELTGILLKKGVNHELQEVLLEHLDAMDDVLIDLDTDGDIIVPAGKWQLNTWKRKEIYLEIKTSKKFNWGSVQHLQWLFFVVLGIEWKKLGIKKSKTTALPSTGADEIDKMIYAHPDVPFFRTLLKKREYEKIRDTYAKGLLEKAEEDTERVHASLNLVRTWRLSCQKPNLQNIPRLDNDDIGIRHAFVAKPGYTLVSCDYSQIELRVMAYYANDANMKDAYAKDQDLHSRVAKEVWKLPCTVEEVKSKYKSFRYKAKSVNFGICYGSTEHGLYANINGDALNKAIMTGAPYEETPIDECKTVIDNYKATFPGLVAYANTQINFAREHGYVETLFGHRRPITYINHPNEYNRKKAENMCMNTPVQGSASDIIRLAMVNYQKAIFKKSETDPRWKNVRMVMQIHDDIITECPEEMAGEVAALKKQVMEIPINDFLKEIGRPADFDVKIVGEPAVGSVWAKVLDVSIKDGVAKVKVKEQKNEALDITLEDLSQEELEAYKKAGIEVWRGKERVA